MITLRLAPQTYTRAGLVLGLAPFGLFLAALPPLQAGIWLQTEPVMVLLFALATLQALWLGTGLYRGWLIGEALSPLWIAAVSWIAWQCLVSVLAMSPWRSWFGPPETGEGAGWYCALWLQSLVMYALWPNMPYRRWLLMGGMTSLVMQCGLHLAYPGLPEGGFVPGSFAPAQWAAYLAFMVGGLWIGLVAAGMVRSWKGYALLSVLTGLVVIISQNKSAMVIMPFAALLSLLLATSSSRWVKIRLFAPSTGWRAVAAAACLLPTAWVGFSLHYPAFSPEVPQNAIQAMLSKKDGPMSSRLALNQIGMEAMWHEPERWLIGGGWGRFTDDLYKYLLVDGIHVFEHGERRPNWFLVDGYAYHSHNQPLEALLSLGMPGLLLWFSLPALAIFYIPNRCFWGIAPMVVAMTLLAAFWFELAPCTAFNALAWAGLCRIAKPPSLLRKRERRYDHSLSCNSGGRLGAPGLGRGVRAFLPLLFYSLAALMTWSANEQWQAMRYGESLYRVLENKRYGDYSLAWMLTDNTRGGDRFRASAQGYGKLLARQSDLSDEERRWYVQYLETAHIMARIPHIGPRVASTELWLQYTLLLELGSLDFRGLGRQEATKLPDSVLLMASKAPLRDDVATVFLLNISDILPDIPKQHIMLSQLLGMAPNHRPAAWMLGNLEARMPDHRAKAETIMRNALIRSLEDVFPIKSSQ